MEFTGRDEMEFDSRLSGRVVFSLQDTIPDICNPHESYYLQVIHY